MKEFAVCLIQRENINGCGAEWYCLILLNKHRRVRPDMMRTYQRKVIILSLFSVFGCGNGSDELPNVPSWGVLLRYYEALQQCCDMARNWLGIRVFQQIRTRLTSSLKRQKERKHRKRDQRSLNISSTLPCERDKLIVLFLAVGSHCNLML